MDIASALQLRNTSLQNNAQVAQRKAERAIQQDNSAYDRKKAQLEEVGKSFEQIFINQMLSSMRETLDKKSDVLYGGLSQDIFEDMLYEKYAENMAKTNFLGLSQTIVSQYEQYL